MLYKETTKKRTATHNAGRRRASSRQKGSRVVGRVKGRLADGAWQEHTVKIHGPMLLTVTRGGG